MKDKRLIRITRECEDMLVITDKGVLMQGTTPALLSLYRILTKTMLNLKGADKELLDHAYNSAFISAKEIEKDLESELKKLFKNLEEMVSGKNNE